MENRLKNDYENLLRSLKDRYCRLLLVTGDSEQKTKNLAQIWDQGISPLQVSRALSAIFVDASLSMRTQIVLDFFANFVNQSEMLCTVHHCQLTDIVIIVHLPLINNIRTGNIDIQRIIFLINLHIFMI